MPVVVCAFVANCCSGVNVCICVCNYCCSIL